MLKEKIIGAWELVSFTGIKPDGTIISPMGRAVTGSIIYSADGYVSAILARGDRVRNNETTDFHKLDKAQAGEIAQGFLAYSGPYKIDEENSIITHDFKECLDPILIGTLQQRHAKIIGDKLELSVKNAQGVTYPSTLLWQRPNKIA